MPSYRAFGILRDNCCSRTVLLRFSEFSIVREMPVSCNCRLIPCCTCAFERVFTGATQMRYYRDTVDSLYIDMTEMPPPPAISDKRAAKNPPEPMPFEREISLRDVSFHYPSLEAAVLEKIHLTIPKNTTVGFVGMTGCGKTTLVDVIMGLVPPRSGEFLVDGQAIDGTGVAASEASALLGSRLRHAARLCCC